MSMSKVYQDSLSPDGILFHFLAEKHKVPRAREQLSKLSGKLNYTQRVICGFEGRLKSLSVCMLEHSK